MPTSENSTVKATKSRIFFYLGILSLVLMSLLSGLDRSFFYIFLGLGAYCFFLSYWTRPITTDKFGASGADDFFSNFRKTFGTRAKESAYRKPVMPLKEKSRVILFIFSFVAFIFFFIVFITLTMSDSSESDSAIWYQQGLQFRDSGQNDSAKFYFRKTFPNEEQRAQSYLEYGNVLLNETNYDSAILYYTKALNEDATFGDAWYNRSLAKYYLKNYDASRNDAFDLLAMNAAYDDATLMLGDNYYAEKRYDSAIYWYEEAYDRGIKTAPLLHVMAYIYDTRNEETRAIQFYKGALEYDSTKAEIYQRLSELIPEEAQLYQVLYNKYKE
jgi:tetratricopeptide (TPR) repeat protein